MIRFRLSLVSFGSGFSLACRGSANDVLTAVEVQFGFSLGLVWVWFRHNVKET